MRILFISNFYPPYELGGMEIRCRETVDLFKKRGHICQVLTSQYGLKNNSLSETDITRSLYLQTDIYHYHPLDFFLKWPWQELANKKYLSNKIDAFQPDIIFIWGMWNLSPTIAYWSEQWRPNKVAYNFGGYWPLERDPHTSYWNNILQRSHGYTKSVLHSFAKLALAILRARGYPPKLDFKNTSCCSRHVADTLTESGIVTYDPIVIPNGIDPSSFITISHKNNQQKGVLRLIYFGSLIENKGVHIAIEALGLLQQRKQIDNLHLTIVGSGHPDYQKQLVMLINSFQLQDKITFTGRVSRSEIPNILSRHDVFLFTSIYPEPFGRTILEAMAAGLIVIGSSVGGSKEIFEFYSEDMLFEPGDAESLANKIQLVIDNPTLHNQLAQTGISLVLEQFTLNRMVDEMEMWLQKIVA